MQFGPKFYALQIHTEPQKYLQNELSGSALNSSRLLSEGCTYTLLSFLHYLNTFQTVRHPSLTHQ